VEKQRQGAVLRPRPYRKQEQMARIHVPYNFGGTVTGERRILPGEYDISDPALFGAGRYMLANGHATLVDGELDPEPSSGNVAGTAPAGDEPTASERLAALQALAEESPDTEVRLYFVGKSKGAHTVKVNGVEYAVPKADGTSARPVDVAAKHAEALLARGTFALNPEG
jgi:hypothetical protein